jgi:hypothetical protein
MAPKPIFQVVSKVENKVPNSGWSLSQTAQMNMPIKERRVKALAVRNTSLNFGPSKIPLLSFFAGISWSVIN